MSEREEYTAENYPSFGKKYNGEKAIISLTSWKARINTVSKTLYSLLKQCPGFHIVLVLSEEEFPKMMDELPDNLKLFVDNELVEVLWVYKNYKSLKKILFTMAKYPNVPVISADDDCIYTCNYAEKLFNEHTKNDSCLITMWIQKLKKRIAGPCTLYYPHCFGDNFNIQDALKAVNYEPYLYSDDSFIEYLRAKYKDSKIVCIQEQCFRFHDEVSPMHDVYSKKGFLQNLRQIQTKDAGKNIFDIIGDS